MQKHCTHKLSIPFEKFVILGILKTNSIFYFHVMNIQKLMKEYSVVLIFVIVSVANKLLSNVNDLSSEQQTRLSEFIPRLVSLFEQISSPLPLTTNYPYLNDLLVNFPDFDFSEGLPMYVDWVRSNYDKLFRY